MKNFFKVTGKAKMRSVLAIALVAVIGFSMAACPNDGGGDDDPNTMTYTGKKDGKAYTLKITKAATSTGTTPGGTTNPFVGKWTGADVDGRAMTIVFTETTWTAAYVVEEEPNPAIGTYTYSGSRANLYYDGFVAATGVITGSTLKVTGNEATIKTPWTLTKGRSVLNVGFARSITPEANDTYTLQVGSKRSTGTVKSVSGNTLSLQPKASNAGTFEATIGDNGLTNVTGLITFDDGDQEPGPGELDPVNTPNGGGGSGNMKWTIVMNNAFGNGGYGSGFINAIAYGNGKFVAGGSDGKMTYSTDGINWTAVADSTFGTTTIGVIAFGNGKFVAGGASGTMAYSADGINWTPINEAKTIFGTERLHSGILAITYGNNKFVAGGSDSKMAYSADGINWTAASCGASADFSFQSIAYGNGKFVALGSFGKEAYSTDGINWTALKGTSSGLSNVILYGNGKFVKNGSGYTDLYYSLDGITWSWASTELNIERVTYFAYGNGKFVGISQKKSMSSTDGVTWTAETTIGDISSLGVAYGNGTFVVVGWDCKTAYSKD